MTARSQHLHEAWPSLPPANADAGADAGAVFCVDTPEGFAALRPAFDDLMSRDAAAHLFLSWDWLAQAFAANPGRWRVFAVPSQKRPGAIACLFPAKYRSHWSESRGAFETEIEAGGRLLWSEYTGFLCDPDEEAAALGRLAAHLVDLPWARLSMRYEPTGERAAMFLDALADAGFATEMKPYRINRGKTDNLCCPRIALPDDYETYVETMPRRNARRKIRRFTRRWLDSGALRVDAASHAEVPGYLDILEAQWLARWSPAKGEARARRLFGNIRDMLMAAQGLNALHLPVLWQGNHPLGALGCVIDWQRRSLHFLVAGRDEEAELPCIGLLLHAETIRWAIAYDLKTYDFCHGDESYKFDFGATAHHVAYLSAERRTGPRLDPICLPDVLSRARDGLAEGGDAARARAGLDQALALIRPGVTPLSD